jgi:pSer/pThr/pTyr-binding forkhead associated (FHA) protein
VNLEWTLLALRLLAVAVLYAFLLITIYVIWRDLRGAASAQPQETQVFASVDQSVALSGHLRVVGGAAPSQPGDIFVLQAPTTLGRAPDNLIVLPDTCVSAYHARLDRRDGEWWLTDLGSRNGTRLNDVPISKPVPLANGDVIGIGQVELKFEIAS